MERDGTYVRYDDKKHMGFCFCLPDGVCQPAMALMVGGGVTTWAGEGGLVRYLTTYGRTGGRFAGLLERLLAFCFGRVVYFAYSRDICVYVQ